MHIIMWPNPVGLGQLEMCVIHIVYKKLCLEHNINNRTDNVWILIRYQFYDSTVEFSMIMLIV